MRAKLYILTTIVLAIAFMVVMTANWSVRGINLRKSLNCPILSYATV